MEKISDYSIFQNHVLGAHALWEFAKSYQEYEANQEPPVLLLALPVLPIVFNKRTTDIIKRKSFKEGGLFKVIAEHKDIYTGLQERMEQTTNTTFKSINIAVASELLIYNRDTTQLIPNLSIKPQIKRQLDYIDIIASSKRLGAWFAKLSLQEISDYFNIKY